MTRCCLHRAFDHQLGGRKRCTICPCLGWLPQPPSRQVAYQQRHKAAGLCRYCGKPAVTRDRCQEHRIKMSKARRA